MTMTSVLASPRLRSAPVLSGPRYSLFVSTDPEHREAAQRLRRRVFATEPGFRLPAGAGDLDEDRFDEYCDHVLVHDHHTDTTVGCYRMLSPEAARAAGGYYTATEFDLSVLDPFRLGAVEMGRACVDPAHRSGSVLTLMWAGILRYLELTGHTWVFGCVSVPMRSHPGEVPGANALAVRDVVLSRHAADPDQQVRPLRPVPVPVPATEPGQDGPIRAVLPPLMRGYLRLGARICGEPAHDPDFGVADFVALLSLNGADQRYLERLRGAAEQADRAAGVPA